MTIILSTGYREDTGSFNHSNSTHLKEGLSVGDRVGSKVTVSVGSQTST